MKKLRLIVALVTVNSAVAAFISYMNFHGVQGESYSILNHFVSELGDLRYSSTAWIFDASFITLTILLTLWFGKINELVELKNKKLITVIFIISMISVASVGIFNRNIQPWHKVATTLTFTSVSILMLVLTNALVQVNGFANNYYRKLTISLVFFYFGLFAIAAFFFNVPYMSQVTDGMITRPQIWPIAILEWGIFISMLVWVVAIAIGITPQTTEKGNTHSSI